MEDKLSIQQGRPIPQDDLDVEGNMPYRKVEPAVAEPGTDKADAKQAQVQDEPDTEGHKFYSRSDRNVKTDITPVAWDAR